MKKITKLTKEQESKLPVYRDIYLDKFFNNQHVTTQEECEEYFEFFYKEFTDIKEKPKVILLDSPMALLIEKTRIDNEINGTNNPVTFEPICYNASAFNNWISFYDFFDKEVLTFEKSELFNKYRKILDMNIFWSLTYDTHVFVSRNAIEYKRNRNFELHNVDGAAVTFRDGFKLYFINGVGIKEELFNKLLNKKYTFEDFTLEKNEEIKAAVLVFFEEKWGSAYMFDFISKNLKEVNT